MAWDYINTGTKAADDIRTHGTTGQNTLTYTGKGDDVIRGGRGNDTIVGGPGSDKMWGGAGADTFLFNAREVHGTGDNDYIYDLNFGEGDRIGLANFGGTVGNTILRSMSDLVHLVNSSAQATAHQKGATDVLVLHVADMSGNVENIYISHGWADYLAAGGSV